MVESTTSQKGILIACHGALVGPIGETPKLRVINSFSKEKVT